MKAMLKAAPWAVNQFFEGKMQCKAAMCIQIFANNSGS